MGAFYLSTLMVFAAFAAEPPEDMPVVSTGAFTAPAVSSPTMSLYMIGMNLRRAGDNVGARKMFQQLLDKNPDSGGALEGLTITAISLGLYEEALSAIERWEMLGKSPYIDSLKASVLAKLHPENPAPGTTAAAVSTPAVSYYTLGMDLRRSGNYQGAKEAFLKLLEQDPESGGALEGLTLTSLSLGQNEEALDYAERWEKQKDSGYIQSMKARALAKLGRREELAESLRKSAEFDPGDIRAARRLDDILREEATGVFTQGAISKTLSQEGLGTRSVNQIIYESRSGGFSGRVIIKPGLNATAGVTVSQTAQRNGSRHFTYFDVLEQVYSAGLEQRSRRGGGFAHYGQSLLSDVKAVGVGRKTFSRVKAGANYSAGDLELRAFYQRSPYYLRGAGGDQFFALLRESTYRVEAEAPWRGMSWLARGAINDYSGRVTVHTQSLTGTLEGGSYLVVGSLARGAQEYFGAGPTGKLTIMPYNRAGLRGRLGTDGRWQASASYGHSAFRDGNRENDGDADFKLWLPKTGPVGLVWVSYGFSVEEYLTIADGYRSSDKRSHWTGLFWKRQWRSGPWIQVGYEHGFLVDTRGRYEGNRWTSEIEWYRGRPFSLTAQARYSNTTVRDQSAAGGLQARWTF